MTHAELSQLLIRPPGCPPSSCPGELHRVNGSGERIDEHAQAILDDAQAGEGPVGSFVSVRLHRCERCHATLVVSECRDINGNTYLRMRNDHSKPLPDRAASNGVADPVVAYPAAIS